MMNPNLLPNLDSEPEKLTPGETDFFFGHNRPEEDGETLLAFEDLAPEVQKAIQEKRKDKMITIQRNNVPQGGAQTPKGVQFLKPMHATKQGVTATIYKVTSPDNGGKLDNFQNPYVVYFTIGGQKYSKGFKSTSDNLASLVDLLGADESKWTKKTIKVYRDIDDDQSERLRFGKE
jgi:hypothetical protein